MRMSNVNIINAIPEDKPHCGNCFWFDGDDDDERLQFCDEREEYVARFGTCQKWRKKT